MSILTCAFDVENFVCKLSIFCNKHVVDTCSPSSSQLPKFFCDVNNMVWGQSAHGENITRHIVPLFNLVNKW